MAASGVVATAYFSARGGYLSAQQAASDDPNLDTKEKVKRYWRNYIPAGASATITIGCLVMANRTSLRKVAAAQAAFAVTEHAFNDYREKVAEEIGEKKEQEIRDKVAQDRVAKDPPAVVIGSGSVLCHEAFTGRYFMSDMEALRRAVNDLNSQLLANDYVYLDDFYHMIDLPCTTESNHIGWQSDKLMELKFTSVLAEEGKPCLSFEYNYTKPL